MLNKILLFWADKFYFSFDFWAARLGLALFTLIFIIAVIWILWRLTVPVVIVYVDTGLVLPEGEKKKVYKRVLPGK